MTEQTGLIPSALGTTSVRHPLALASDAEFTVQLADMKKMIARVHLAKREILTEGADYGIIPGTPKPTIYKPGIEKLSSLFRLAVTYEQAIVAGDDESTPAISVRTHADVHVESKDGPVIAQGIGEANSWEVKHRYRKASRSCPACGVEGSIRRSKAEYGGGWYCSECKAKFEFQDDAIVAQASGRAENQDPYDLVNTLVKMSKKRAQTDGVLTATCSSDLFTQDIDEKVPGGKAETREATAARGPASGTSVRPAKDAVAEMRAIIDEVATAPDFPAINDFLGRLDALREKITSDQWTAAATAINERAEQLRGGKTTVVDHAVDPGGGREPFILRETTEVAQAESVEADPRLALVALAQRAGKVARTGNIWLTDALCERLEVEQKAAGFAPAWICEDPKRLRLTTESLLYIAQKKEGK